MADLYIVGSARSGTTLLLNQLCSYYHLGSVPETHFFSLYNGDFIKFKGSLHYNEVCNALSVDSLGSYDEIWRKARIILGEEFVAEKTPKHLRHVAKIEPHAKVIIVKRRIFDTFRSNITAPWNLGVPLPRIAIKVFVDRVFCLLARVQAPGRTITLRFEDLQSHPDAELSKIASFLNLKLRKERKASLPELGREYWKKEAAGSVMTTKKKYIGAWPRYGITNVRNTIMYDHLNSESDIVVLDIKSRPSLAFVCDFVHFHWPEKAFEGRHRALKSFLFLLWCVCLKCCGVTIIQTVHNDWRDHVVGRLEYLYKLYQKLVALYLVPSSASVKLVPKGKSWNLLPLGLYPRLVKTPDSRTGGYLICGRLTRKKNIERQILELDIPENEVLTIAGMPESTEYQQTLVQASNRSRNMVDFKFGVLSEHDLNCLVANSRCLIAAYEKGLNSGVLTLAATYGTPVYSNMKHLEKDMRRFYGQVFTASLEEPKIYRPTDLSIQRIASRYARIVRKLK